MLARKVDTLTKAMEVEAKKMRREVAAMEKEVSAMRVEKEHENRAKRFGSAKGSVNSALLAGRYLTSPILPLIMKVVFLLYQIRFYGFTRIFHCHFHTLFCSLLHHA